MSAKAIHKELQELSVTKMLTEPSIDIEQLANSIKLPLHLVTEYLQTLVQLDFVTVTENKVKLTPAGKGANLD